MKQKNNKEISRRDFFKIAGAAGMATTGLAACTGKGSSQNSADGKVLGEMTYRTTPTTGDHVSLLGYGMMRLPLRQKADGSGEEVDQETVNALVDYAIAHGVNYFDTSPRYVRGWSETATGIALSRHPRDKYFVATKLSTHPDDAEIRTFEGSTAMYRNSMKALQVDYIDYYLIHATGLGTSVLHGEHASRETGAMGAIKERLLDNGMLDFLLKEREAGRIRNLGWSFHGELDVFKYLLQLHDEGKARWDFVQIQLNYVDWKHASGWNTNAEYLYDELGKRNIPAVIMEPLLGGRLASLADFLNARLKQLRPQESIASWAFRFAGTHEHVLTVLSGMTYMEHLQDNIRTFSPLEPCSEEELALLEDAAQRMLEIQTVPCTTCEYCMPCPYGINIPAIFSHYNKCINEGNVVSSSQDENYKKARRAFLIGYDRSVPRLRQANHCIGCNQCAQHCPQSIKIPEQLHRIDRYVEQLKQGTL